MTRIRKTLLLVSPLLLAIILLFIKTTSGAVTQGSSFDVLRFYFVDNLDFTLAIGLILTEFGVAVIIFDSETQQKLSGKWEVRFDNLEWKDQAGALIVGRGSVHLAKSPFGEDNFVGYMYVGYWDEGNTQIHKGVYEIRLALRRKTVTGQSTMLWGEGYGEAYVSGDIDTPYVSPCLYNLQYLADAEKLTGEARMQDGPTAGRFVAYRV